MDEAIQLLREKLTSAEKKASDLWADFQAKKREVEESGADLGKSEVWNPILEASKAYKAAAGEASKMKERLLEAYESGKIDGSGNGGTKAPVPGAWPTNVSNAFLEAIGGIEGGQKALVSGSGAGAYVAPFWDPRLRELPQRRLFVRSLIPSQPNDSDFYWYLRQSVATHNAAPVATGGLKPTSVYTIERLEEAIRTIAHLSEPIDNVILSDEPSLRTFLDGQLRLGVLLAEENQIINGNGTPPNLRGILSTAGILTQARGSDPHVDAILKGIVKVRNQDNPFEPTGIVMHPTDWQTVVLTKDAGGDYQANESGAFSSADAGDARGDRLWGKPVVQSRVMAQGTALVGDFTACTIFDREQPTIQVSESGALGAGGVEIFSRNQVVFRGEERIGFGVERPAAFCTVTGL